MALTPMMGRIELVTPKQMALLHEIFSTRWKRPQMAKLDGDYQALGRFAEALVNYEAQRVHHGITLPK